MFIENEGFLRALADTIPNLVWVSAADGRPLWFNARWRDYTGFEIPVDEQTYRSHWTLIIHPEDAARLAEAWRAAVERGAEYQEEARFRGADGIYRWFLVRSMPTTDVNGTKGNTVYWIGTATNIDEHKRSEARLEFLMDASEVLGNSLDVDTTLRGLVRLAVPRIADWCAVYLENSSGSLKPVAIAHEDASMVQLAHAFVEQYPPDESSGTISVFRTGKPSFVPIIPPEIIIAAARDDQHREMLQKLDIRSALTVAIATNTRIFGVLQLVCGLSGRELDQSDLQLAQTLAMKAATAIETAQIFEREQQVSHAFQRAALPKSLPQVPGLVFSEVYQPGKTEALVGGDWYDALHLSDGRVVLSIGDVAGSGLQAAVIMASMRQVIRGVAQVYADPKTIIEAANRSLQAEHGDRLVTAFVGIYDPIECTLSYTNAGHPGPYVRDASGRLSQLSVVGLPLGLRQKDGDETVTVAIEPESTFILFTDGLIESTRNVLEGEAQLLAALQDRSNFIGSNTAHALYQAVTDGRADDDVVVLTVSLEGGVAHESWDFHTNDAAAAQDARNEFGEMLLRYGYSEGESRTYELVFGELLSNTVRYAPGNVHVVLDCSHQANPVLHFLDEGPGFLLVAALPTDLLSENGRGLFLIWNLVEGINVTKRMHGGSHARVVLARKKIQPLMREI